MKRNKFNLSHHKMFTCNMGELIPSTWFEVLPGDSIQQASSALVRTTPLLKPMFSQVDIRIHHFYVPNRLIWEDWEDFITGGPDGEDASVHPTISSTAGVGGLSDYLGAPTGLAMVRSALPSRAYSLIWNEYYRDQDLQPELAISLGSGPDATSYLLQNVAWEKDYFTSARPWPQKGPEVTIPLAGTADIVATGPLKTLLGSQSHFLQSVNAATSIQINPAATTTGSHVYDSGLEVDLSSSTVVGINALREAFALQRYAEARARYGSRYTEYLAYLGIRSSDARLQRPEYLGGGRQRLQISEVLQTGVDSADDGVGNLAGHGIGIGRTKRYRRYFEEHGIVMSLFSVKPRTVYYQGLWRKFNRETKEDYWQKELEHIGQQEILKKEVKATATSTDDETWGYQDRYDEYRRIENSVSGEFRTTELDWHMARDLGAGATPTLNADFVKSNPTDRVYAVNAATADPLQVVVNHSVQARRMVSRSARSFIL